MKQQIRIIALATLAAVCLIAIPGCDPAQWNAAVDHAQQVRDEYAAIVADLQAQLAAMEAEYRGRSEAAAAEMDALQVALLRAQALLAEATDEAAKADLRREIREMRDAQERIARSDAAAATEWADAVAGVQRWMGEAQKALDHADDMLEIAQGKASQAEQFDALVEIGQYGAGLLGATNVATLLGLLRTRKKASESERVAEGLVTTIDLARTGTSTDDQIVIDTQRLRGLQEARNIKGFVDRVRKPAG
jgi:ElaB/YqjD/DUF883 family membrane-anchored ribosome-binding protein